MDNLLFHLGQALVCDGVEYLKRLRVEPQLTAERDFYEIALLHVDEEVLIFVEKQDCDSIGEITSPYDGRCNPQGLVANHKDNPHRLSFSPRVDE